MSSQPLKIFVVDDDSTARMIACFSFDSPEYKVFEFSSGEQCLAALNIKPDVILMDIEMPGMGGIAACHALRKAGETNTQVIFLSGHNDMDTRMHAYDAGGNDYLMKPYEPEEVLRKVTAAQILLKEKQSLTEQAQYAQQAAFTAMSSMGELGIIMQFMRASFAASTQKKLAEALFNTIKQLDLRAIVQIHKPEPGYTASSLGGDCTQLELSILAHAMNMDHVFQFRDRLIINDNNITLVAFNLPLNDPDRVGRLRDNLATLVEAANARLAAIISDQLRISQSTGIGEVASELTLTLKTVEAQQGKHRLNVLQVMNDYIRDLEAAYVRMELSHEQEKRITTMATQMAEKIGNLVGDDKDLSDRLRTVSDRLKQLSHSS